MNLNGDHCWHADATGTLHGAITRSDSQLLAVALAGEIDLANAAELALWLTTLAHETTALSMCIDASAVTFCDVAGVRALLSVQAAAARRDLPCAIGNPSQNVERLLRMTGAECLLR
ncbi:STAS domain-containing protein [Actinoplanes oblitus]|uniref:STAS domain-containing protein n=1 Tax=Actinoplanes oblitus TaxID=3040509 RepID=A0ABY8WBC5_9ACTN|nr:STAS domain-containing protein [Actinoplanes oblitus]WIM93015.1 STAS domain-containing protein [Actinoplanes oblitus]